MWGKTRVLWLGVALLWAASAAAQEEEIPELEEIVVTATRAERDLLDTPGSATVIDREALQEEGGADIGDVVHETEGVDVLRYGGPGSSTTAHLRGTYGVHTLVLVDGRTQNAPSRGSADLSGLSPAFIERVEIVRGPASALYGTGAVGGVVQVFTRDIPEEPINEAYASFGSFGTARATFLDGRPFGSGGALLGLDAFRTDGHRPNSDAEAMELFSKFGFGDVEGGRTVVTLGLRDSRAGWPGPEPAPDPLDRTATQLAFGNDEVSSLVDFGESVSGHVQAEYRRGEFRARLSVDRQEEDPHQERMNWDSGDASYHHIVQEDSYDTTKPELEASMKWELSPAIKVSAGGGLAYDRFAVDTLERDLDAASVTTDHRTDERTTASVWGQAEFDEDPWQGIVGVRWDEPSDYDGKASGRLLGAWKNDTGLRLEAGIGTAFRAPSLNDLNWPASAYAEGNPDLKPESAWEGDLAVKWTPEGREKTRLTATIFHKEVDDFIMWCPDTSGIWRPENLNHVEIRGLELAGMLPLGAGFQAKLAYTLLDATESGPRLTHVDYAAPDPYTFTETERDLAYAPDHQVDLGIEWSKETGSGKAKVGLSVSWGSDIRQYYEDWVEVVPLTEYDVEYPHKELEAHWLFGLRAAWSWSEKNEVFIKIENLLDEGYATQFGYTLEDGDYPMPGRTVTVGARFNF